MKKPRRRLVIEKVIRNWWEQRTFREQYAVMAAFALLLIALFAAVAPKGNGKKKVVSTRKVATIKRDTLLRIERKSLIDGAIIGFMPVIFDEDNGNEKLSIAMKRLDMYAEYFAKAAKEKGLDEYSLMGVALLESKLKKDALSGASCAGIAQFAAPTARDMGLNVERNWHSLYAQYQKSKSAEDWARLVAADDRFDPEKAIAAQAKFLSVLKKQFGGEDFAIAGYHMGPGNMSKVLNLYGVPGKSWGEIVVSASPYKHPNTNAFLYGHLDDASWSYYFRVQAAIRARKLWESDKKAFYAMERSLNVPGPNALAMEKVWYHPQESDAKTNAKPRLAKNAADVLASVNSQMKEQTGKDTHLASIRLQGRGFRLNTPKNARDKKVLAWILEEGKRMGDLVWLEKDGHFIVTAAPSSKTTVFLAMR